MTGRRTRGAAGARPEAGAHGSRRRDRASVTPNRPGPFVTSAEFARSLGVSKSAVTFWTREAGAPYDSRGWRWPECIHWYIWREVTRGR